MFDALSDRLEGIFTEVRNRGRLSEHDIDEVDARDPPRAARSRRERPRRTHVHRPGEGAARSAPSCRRASRPVSSSSRSCTTSSSRRSAVTTGKLTMSPKPPTVVMLAGLQGSGKTTAAGKLARLLKSQGLQPLLVGADLQRPAAVEQLRVLAGARRGAVLLRPGRSRSTSARGGIAEAAATRSQRRDRRHRGPAADRRRAHGRAPRHPRRRCSPHNTLLVVDAMTGQEAVNVATAFHEAVGLDGVILTKIDGDARGGAALSVKEVVGKPILFAGTGEKLDEFEPFHPDRMAGRILGMGDVLTLIEKAEAAFDTEQKQQAEEILREGTFTLEDFLDQMQQVKKMGPIQNVIGMLPGMPKEVRNAEIDDREITRIEAIIRSMTPAERRKPDLINGSRRGAHRQGRGRELRRRQQPAQAVQADAADDALDGRAAQGQEGQAPEAARWATFPAFRAGDPSLDSPAALNRALRTRRSCIGSQDPFDARRQEEAAELSRRRRRLAQPARRPVHRDARPVRAARRAVGRDDRLRPRAALAERVRSRPSRSASCSRSPACGTRTRPSVGKDAASKPKAKSRRPRPSKPAEPAPKRRPPAEAAGETRPKSRGRRSVRMTEEEFDVSDDDSTTTTTSKTMTTTSTTTTTSATRSTRSAREGNRVTGARAKTVIEHVARQLVDDPDGVFVDATERVRQRRDPDPHEPRRPRPHHRQARSRDPGAASGRAGGRGGRGRAGHGRGRGVAPSARSTMTSEPGPASRSDASVGRTDCAARCTSSRSATRRAVRAAVRGCSSANASSWSRRRAPERQRLARALRRRRRPRRGRGAARADRARRRARRRARGRALGARAHRREVRDRSGADSDASTRSRRTPRTISSCSTAARSCRWCSSSSRRPGVVVVDLPDGLLGPVSRRCAIDVFTIFPEYLDGPLAVSLVGRARERGLLDVRVHDLREYATDVHRAVDDAPFGGGAGMVMMPEPLFAAVEAVQPPRPLLLLSASGAALRPGARARAGRDRRRLLVAVRPLRRRRPAGRRPLLRRRALGRRLRARRRRGGRARRDRGRHPPGARRDGQRRRRAPRSRLGDGRRWSSTRSTRGRPGSAMGRARGRCGRVTTPASRAGGGPSRCAGPASAGPI